MEYSRKHKVERANSDDVKSPGLRSPHVADVDEPSRGLRCNVGTIDQKFESIREIEKFAQQEQFQFNEDRWQCIKQIRDTNCGATSDELAPAEHYAYARNEVSKHGLSEYLKQHVSIDAYDAAKRLMPEWVQERLLKQGNCQIAPATQKEVDWGKAGAVRGLSDYEKGRNSNDDRLDKGETMHTDTVEHPEHDVLERDRRWD